MCLSMVTALALATICVPSEKPKWSDAVMEGGSKDGRTASERASGHCSLLVARCCCRVEVASVDVLVTRCAILSV